MNSFERLGWKSGKLIRGDKVITWGKDDNKETPADDRKENVVSD